MSDNVNLDAVGVKEQTTNHLDHLQKKSDDNTTKRNKPRSHPCKHCKISFSNKKKFNKHMSKNHKNSAAKYLYNICSKSFKWLKKHMQVIHEFQENHCCDTCGKEFNYKMLLSIHVRNVHEVTNDQCDKCSKICKNKPALQKHIKHNHN